MATNDELAKLVIKISADVSDVKKVLADVSAAVRNTAGEVEKSAARQKSALGQLKEGWLGFAAKVTAVYLAVRKGMQMMEEGARALAVEESFAQITKEMGIDGDKLIAKLKEVSYVFVETTDVAAKAQRLLMEGLTQEEVVKTMEAARIAARLMGVDVETAFERIAEALITLQTRGLKRAFPMDVTETVDKFATKMNLTSDAINDAGKRQAILNEILDQAQKKLKALGGELSPNASEKLQRFNSSIKQLQEDMGKTLIPVLGAAAAGLKYFTSIGIGAAYAAMKLKEYDLRLRAFSQNAEAAKAMRAEADAIGGAATELKEMVTTLVTQGTDTLVNATNTFADQVKKSSEEYRKQIEDAAKAQKGEKVEMPPGTEKPKEGFIDWKKLGEARQKVELAMTQKTEEAKGQIVLAELEISKQKELSARLEAGQDLEMIEIEMAKKAAETARDERLKVLAAERASAIAGAKSQGLTTATEVGRKALAAINEAYDKEDQATRTKAQQALTTIDEEWNRKRIAIIQEARQKMEGGAFEVPTERETAEMEVRSKERAEERAKMMEDYNLSIAQAGGSWEEVLDVQLKNLDAERDRLIATNNYKDAEEAVIRAYYDAQKAILKINTELAQQQKIAQLNVEMAEYTGDFGGMIEARRTLLDIEVKQLKATGNLTDEEKKLVDKVYEEKKIRMEVTAILQHQQLIAQFRGEAATQLGDWEGVKNAQISMIEAERQLVLMDNNLSDAEKRLVNRIYDRRVIMAEAERDLNGQVLALEGMRQANLRYANDVAQMYGDIIPNAVDAAANSFKGFFDDVIDGQKSIGEAAKDMAINFGKAIADMLMDLGLAILKMQLMKFLTSSIGGLGTGGEVGFALGGSVPGQGRLLQAKHGLYVRGSKGAPVPVIAHKGEYVQPIKSVDYYGSNVMEALRQRAIPRELLLPYSRGLRLPAGTGGSYQTGGGVNQAAQQNNIVNVPININDAKFSTRMRSEVERTVVRVLKEYSR